MDLILLAAFIGAVIIVVVAIYYFLKLAVKIAVWLILNAFGGLLILLVSNFIFNMGIPYDLPTVLLCVLGGVPGAICIDILALIGFFL